MVENPKIGMRVRLNDLGLETIFGSKLGLSHMKTKTMLLTYVDSESMTEPEETFVVEVDDPEINEYFLNNWCFDQVGTTIESIPKNLLRKEPQVVNVSLDKSSGVIDVEEIATKVRQANPSYTGPLIIKINDPDEEF